MANPSSLLIVVATYNERDNVSRLLERMFRVLPDAEVLVIDDNSPDGTGLWCQEVARTDSRVQCVIRKNVRGLGSATILGLKTGIEHGHELICTMDADLSHDPECLPKMIEAIDSESNDPRGAVIGSRYITGGKIVGWPLSRKIASRCTNALARIWLGLKTRDNTSAFRVYRAASLRRLDLNSIKSSGYGYLEEMVYKLQKLNIPVVECPITFVDRQSGRSKASFSVGIRAICRILSMRFQ